MVDIDMSKYDGAKDLEYLADFIERTLDGKGLRLKLGGWPEHQSFNSFTSSNCIKYSNLEISIKSPHTTKEFIFPDFYPTVLKIA